MACALKYRNKAGEPDPVEFMVGKEALAKEAAKSPFDDSYFKLEYVKLMSEEPFVALFGGGPNLWESSLVTPDLMPNITPLKINGCIVNDIYDEFSPIDIKPWECLEYVGIVRNDDLYNFLTGEDVGEPDVDAWIMLNSDDRSNKKGLKEKKKKDDKEKEDAVSERKKVNLSNLTQFECVHSNIPFCGSFIVKQKNTSDEVFKIMQGLVLLGIKDVRTQQLGGLVRNGWGMMDVRMETNGDSDECENAALNYIEEKVEYDALMHAFGMTLKPVAKGIR